MSSSGSSRAGSNGAERPDRRHPAEQVWSNALGGFIRAQRQMAKLSLREMAAMTSVSNAYLSQVERGLHQPSLKVLRSIAEALQLSTDQMLSQAGWAPNAREDDGADRAEREPRPAAGGTEAAIRADDRLTDDQKTALIGVYRSFVDRAEHT